MKIPSFLRCPGHLLLSCSHSNTFYIAPCVLLKTTFHHYIQPPESNTPPYFTVNHKGGVAESHNSIVETAIPGRNDFYALHLTAVRKAL